VPGDRLNVLGGSLLPSLFALWGAIGFSVIPFAVVAVALLLALS